MVVLGLVLLLLGAVVILVGVMTADTTGTGTGIGAEVLGIDVSPVTLFLLGAGSAAAVLWGFSLTRLGARKAMQARREHKKLTELSEKLDRARAEEREDD
ncbi:hypothetical protein [uncultured Nocardioides sp.]|uniref:hypothetical protein n=1 Tax=uncultured Nocardioides sp. TaxID=198441 RepID=UPI0026D8965F|tara:strand:+ start:500 stop:799 length:300 start_codon:yes stop_codon:yes gene_type:complete